MSSAYPVLFHFCGAWLSQDWHLEYATVWDALDDFVTCEPSSVAELRREVRAGVGHGYGAT